MLKWLHLIASTAFAAVREFEAAPIAASFRHTQLCGRAAKCGNLEMLKWLSEHGFSCNEYTFCEACGSGNVDILVWLTRNGMRVTNINECYMSACRSGHVNVLRWLLENDYNCDESTFYEMQQATVELFWNHGDEWHRRRRQDILEWLETIERPETGTLLFGVYL